LKIAFQDTNIEFGEVIRIAETLKSLNQELLNFGVIPFTQKVTNCNFLEPTTMLGGTKIIKLFLGGHLPKNAVIFYDVLKFDQSYYNRFLKLELLNHRATFHKWGQIKNLILDKPFFVKPSCDLKYFAGAVIHNNENTIENEIQSTQITDSDLNDEVMILLNNELIYNIDYEYRIFVVNNEIIDCCQYQKNGKVIPEIIEDLELRDKIYSYIQKIQSLYSPHDHYVIDLAQIGSEFKVIEYNCLNCSGIYMIDRKKVYKHLLEL
jgi:hypothetical protein